jgi:RNA polymerase-binding transcription factor DksA
MTTTRGVLLTERARAQERVAALDRELAGISEAAAQPGTDDEHDPEGATLAFERQHTAALLAGAREQITEIDAAISRLDDGTYGTCARCGQPVGEDRLAARPAAATCVRCARLPSRGHGQSAGGHDARFIRGLLPAGRRIGGRTGTRHRASPRTGTYRPAPRRPRCRRWRCRALAAAIRLLLNTPTMQG